MGAQILHLQVSLNAMRLTVGGWRSCCVAGVVAAVWDIRHDMVLTAHSLPEVDTQLRYNLPHRDAVWQQLRVSPRSTIMLISQRASVYI